ncbi:MAG: SH3 domain-containing protein [Lachnospiraceae bacterium]|nr:SH3 domain-containing protein [Lachnospiraceae bacterium]
MKKIVLRIRDFVVLYSKYIFPVLLIAVVAVTVSIALGARGKEDSMTGVLETVPGTMSGTESEPEGFTDETMMATMETQGVPYAPLELNAHQEVFTLICTYYDALGNGNAEAVEAICNVVEDMEKIKIRELGNYIEYYPSVEVYTKPGPTENSYIVFAYTKAKFNGFEEEVSGIQTFYVCTKEDGTLYLNESECSQEELDYINEIVHQDDVVELSNKAEVEYSETLVANPDLFEFIAQMESDIRTSIGIIIASQDGSSGQTGEGEQPTEGEQTGEGQQPNEGEQNAEGEQPAEGEQNQTQEPVVVQDVYAKATTAVNIRKSASKTSDRLGQLNEGERVKVLEKMSNGWSKIQYSGGEGFVKSDYLKVEESTGELRVIGTITANTNVRIRSLPSTDGTRLGVFAGGEKMDLLEVADGWCKVLYNGQVAYVSEDYVTKNLY